MNSNISKESDDSQPSYATALNSFDPNYMIGMTVKQLPQPMNELENLKNNLNGLALMMQPVDDQRINLQSNSGIYNRKIKGKSNGCGFCRRNGETDACVMNHSIYDPFTGKVTCPILRNYICPVCGATGDDAHTRSYCPIIHAARCTMNCTLENREIFFKCTDLTLSKVNSAGKLRKNVDNSQRIHMMQPVNDGRINLESNSGNYNRKTNGKSNECGFCRKIWGTDASLMNHKIRDPFTGKVTCPVLRGYKCSLCGATGDYAHTRSYCPNSNATINYE